MRTGLPLGYKEFNIGSYQCSSVGVGDRRMVIIGPGTFYPVSTEVLRECTLITAHNVFPWVKNIDGLPLVETNPENWTLHQLIDAYYKFVQKVKSHYRKEIEGLAFLRKLIKLLRYSLRT